MSYLRIAKPWLLAVVVSVVFGWVVSDISGVALIEDAQAVVGRPWTPASVAGVARRTTRRHIAYGSMLYGLPPGCATLYAVGAPYYHCGGVYYRPQYQGPNVVYVVVPAP